MKENRSVQDTGNNFSLYFGIVLEDKLPNADTIQVELTELTPFVDDNVEAKSDMVKVGDSKTESYENIEVTNSIEAEYFSLITNRRYPPDVKKGEQVLIFRYADSKKYYWYPIGRDDRLRKLERYTISVSNNVSTPDGLSDGNCYTIDLDTLYNKHILLRTSKSAGEPFQYVIDIDAAKSTIHICDDANNQILLDSNVPRILLSNSEGAFVDVAKRNVVITALDDIILKAGRQIITDSPATSMLGESLEVKNTSTSIRSSNSTVVESSKVGLDGSVVANTIQTSHVKSGGYSTGRFRI